LTDTRWRRFTRLLKQYEGWAAALRATHGQTVVTFLQQARLIEEQVHDQSALRRLLGRADSDGAAYTTELVADAEDHLVVRTIEAKTGHATTHKVRWAALDANEYHRLADVHKELEQIAGTAPFSVRLGEHLRDATNFEELREAILTLAQRGIDYYRFKGLGEMDADELRETTMDPSTRTLVQVTMEDAASADLVFSMLMGDQVEPRRAFIEEYALAANLDV
jgi:DNA gyrase subunit B